MAVFDLGNSSIFFQECLLRSVSFFDINTEDADGPTRHKEQAMTTIEQIKSEEEASRKEWEAKTVATKIDGVEYTVADIRKTFDAVCDKSDWKAACAAYVPHQIVGVVCAAIEWFHGRKAWVGGIQPITGKVAVGSDGYAC